MLQLSFSDVPATPVVEVIRSKKRRKTIAAREVDGVVRITIPAWASKEDEARWVDEMVRSLARQRERKEIDLEARATTLAGKYGLPEPASIRWVDNQRARWGSCTPADGSIRISSRLVGMPEWVIDCVIVHELAHLVELHHNERFWALVERYPLAERARGFLMAKGIDGDDD